MGHPFTCKLIFESACPYQNRMSVTSQMGQFNKSATNSVCVCVCVCSGDEGVVHSLPVLSGGLLLPEGPFQPQLQRGHESPDPQPQHQPDAGMTHATDDTPH